MAFRDFRAGFSRTGLMALVCLGLICAAAGPAVTQSVPPVTESKAAEAETVIAPAPGPELKPYIPTAMSSAATSSTTASKKASPKPRPVTPAPAPVAPVAIPANGPIAYQTTIPGVVAKPAQPMVVAPSLPPRPVATPTGAPISAPISPDDIETFTDSVVRTLMQRDHVLGVTVAVVQGNTPLLLKGYGYDRLSPLRPVDPNNSIFRIGSITKAFTWIVARQELEAGRINADASIGNYLPNDVYSEDRRFKPITLRELMDHTSGYEDTSLGHLFQLNGAQLSGADTYFRVHRPKRVRQPGEFASYSNFGAALAARALQQTAHARDVPTLMEARLFQPLGMVHTSLREPYSLQALDLEDLPAPLPAELTQDLSDGFVWDGATYKPQPFDHTIHLSGALGASSTAQDMARLMALMLGNGQIDGIQLYNADSANAFRQPLLKMPEGYNGWASGLMVREAPAGFTTYGHGGATLWFNANMIIVPEMNLGIFIGTNTQTGAALAASYPNLLLDHLTGDTVRPPLMPSPANAYAQHSDYYRAIQGQYVSSRRAYGGLEGAITRLLNTVDVSVDRDGRLILTTQNGLSAFVPASATGFFTQQDSEDPGPAAATGGLHFLFNANGTNVSGFETAANEARYERVGWWYNPSTVTLLTAIMIATCMFVWIMLAKGPGRNEHPTEEQGRATVISACLSLVWLVAIFVFHTWHAALADDPGSLFTHWPAGQVRLASGLAFVATLGTIYQIATTYLVYNGRGRYGDDWPLWQKVAHSLMLAYWLFYIFILTIWGALEPWSW